MKKVLLSFCAFIFIGTLIAQDLELTPNDTVIWTDTSYSQYDPLTTVAKIKNKTGGSVTIDYEVISINAPAGWTTQFCDNKVCQDVSVGQTGTYDPIPMGGDGSAKPQFVAGWIPGDGTMVIDYWVSGNLATKIRGTYTMTAKIDSSNFGVGIYESIENQIQLYPNPASSYFTLKNVTQLQNGRIDIFNLLGNKVKTIQITSLNQIVDVEELNKGLYFVKVYDLQNRFASTKTFNKK